MTNGTQNNCHLGEMSLEEMSTRTNAIWTKCH